MYFFPMSAKYWNGTNHKVVTSHALIRYKRKRIYLPVFLTRMEPTRPGTLRKINRA